MNDFTYEDALLERYGPWETLAAGYGTPRQRRRREPAPTIPSKAAVKPPRRGSPPWCPACGDGADVCMRHGTFWKKG